ncbi:MerR family transcriptional regulator [Pseudoroseicyclus aestuarii]|uniref:MerR-like DNA binding protein n=1 Tax=Pseudoroseicyclus aestuarii TaxID=1795041 RepID=A0A318SVX8_9RHOB|nr:MerR family transcriptional regulator [Pseudoroseicyclus aestuarii]PYE83997.1 MerR-like DNA binding protein [Pseudoroseicyclus aestuarii]
MAKSAEAFRTISEVAEALGTQAHVLRFWETKFTQVAPVKRAGGRRYYRPEDLVLLAGIKALLHDQGMTIKGVQKLLREKGVRHVAEQGTDYLADKALPEAAGAQIAPAPDQAAPPAEPPVAAEPEATDELPSPEDGAVEEAPAAPSVADAAAEPARATQMDAPVVRILPLDEQSREHLELSLRSPLFTPPHMQATAPLPDWGGPDRADERPRDSAALTQDGPSGDPAAEVAAMPPAAPSERRPAAMPPLPDAAAPFPGPLSRLIRAKPSALAAQAEALVPLAGRLRQLRGALGDVTAPSGGSTER